MSDMWMSKDNLLLRVTPRSQTGNEDNGSGITDSWYGKEIASTLGGAKNDGIWFIEVQS